MIKQPLTGTPPAQNPPLSSNRADTGSVLYRYGDYTVETNLSRHQPSLRPVASVEWVEETYSLEEIGESPQGRYKRLSSQPFLAEEHAVWGSLKLRLKNAVINILHQFPGSYYSPAASNVAGYSFNASTGVASFSVAKTRLLDKRLADGMPLAHQLDLWYADRRYPLVSLSDGGTVWNISVKGNPFAGSGSWAFHLIDSVNAFGQWNRRLPDLEAFMIGEPKKGQYGFSLVDSAGGRQVFSWPAQDGYNPDFKSDSFARFFSGLLLFGAGIDEEGTADQLYGRYLVSSLQDDENERLKALVQVWGRSFDQIHYSISALGKQGFVRNNNTGLGVDHRSSAFQQSGWLPQKLFGDWGKEQAFLEQFMAEETYLKGMKGTREGLNAFLSLVGIIPGLVSVDEYISVAQRILASAPLHPDVETVPLDTFLLQENVFVKWLTEQGFSLQEQRDNRKSWVVKPGGAQMYTDLYFGVSYPSPAPDDVVNRKLIRLNFNRDAVLASYPDGAGKAWFTGEVDRQIALVKEVYLPFMMANLLPSTVVVIP